MLEKVKDLKIKGLDIPTMHGHTEIILKSKFGRIERYNSDNTFQSAVLANALRCLGEANNNPYTNDSFRGDLPWKNLVGGLLLFNKSISGSPAYMPADNLMIGNGAYGVVNNGVPSELGSYNQIESDNLSTNSKITQVYDFTTSQANGRINSVCLTSQTGGRIGYGNESGGCLSTRVSIADKQNLSTVGNSHQGFNKTIVGNTQYSFSLSEGVMSIVKCSVALTQASVFDKINKTAITKSLSSAGNHLSLVSEDLFVQADGTNIFILPYKAQEVVSGADAYFYRFDTTDDSLVELAVNNTCGKTIAPMSPHFSSVTICAGFGNNIFAARTVEDKLALFDLGNSGAYIKTLNITIVFGGNARVFGKLSNGLCIVNDAGNTWALTLYIYDVESQTCRITNGALINEYYDYSYDPASDCIIAQTNYYNIAFKNPLYLATINNLSTPVVKEATMSMKVIYSLEEA